MTAGTTIPQLGGGDGAGWTAAEHLSTRLGQPFGLPTSPPPLLRGTLRSGRTRAPPEGSRTQLNTRGTTPPCPGLFAPEQVVAFSRNGRSFSPECASREPSGFLPLLPHLQHSRRGTALGARPRNRSSSSVRNLRSRPGRTTGTRPSSAQRRNVTGCTPSTSAAALSRSNAMPPRLAHHPCSLSKTHHRYRPYGRTCITQAKWARVTGIVQSGPAGELRMTSFIMTLEVARPAPHVVRGTQEVRGSWFGAVECRPAGVEDVGGGRPAAGKSIH